MENITNEEFIKKIKADLIQSKHRFEIHDPRSDVRYKYDTSKEAIKGASRIGSTSFNHISPQGEDSRITQNQSDGEWYRTERDNRNLLREHFVRPLTDIQKEIDNENLNSIVERSEQRAVLKGINPEADQILAKVDTIAFSKIQGQEVKEIAAKIIQKNNGISPNYGQAMRESSPETVEMIAALTVGKKFEEFVNDRISTTEPKRTAKKEKEEEEGIKKKINSQGENKIELDEAFTARQSDKPLLPPNHEKDYVRVGNKYFSRNGSKDLAFTDKGNNLVTASNDEKNTQLMIKVVEARGWHEIKVSGSENFKREAWIEATARGIKVKGYTPQEQDKEEVAKRDLAKSKTDEASLPTATKEEKSYREIMAKAWLKENPDMAIKKYPDLINAMAYAVATDQKVQDMGYTKAEREMVAGRTKEIIADRIKAGTVPEMRIRENVPVQVKQQEQEYER